ncbi:ERI1 exoribonuclease 3 [Anabrus simplex]|uniref:ERI1 exoribonuclease 3 n=1 Tax=Anabrus simplex TaxID=316456 RepID=UPI0034DDB739
MFGLRLAFGRIVSLHGWRLDLVSCHSRLHVYHKALLQVHIDKCCKMYVNQPHRSYQPVMPLYNQNYDFFLVLDFEATCEEGRQIIPQEIIEFPVIKVNARTMKREGLFHRYVQPTRPPSAFCTRLTGIMEEMLINQPPFRAVLMDFENWLIREGLIDKKIIFVTCGNWDLQVMLPDQCSQIHYPVPAVMKSWINIKKIFFTATGIFPRNLMHMLEILGLPHIGRLHSGIDDCLNTCMILEELARRGVVFHRTNNYTSPV